MCWINKDSTYKCFEIIVGDPTHVVICKNPRINWTVNHVHEHYKLRGLAPAGKKYVVYAAEAICTPRLAPKSAPLRTATTLHFSSATDESHFEIGGVSGGISSGWTHVWELCSLTLRTILALTVLPWVCRIKTTVGLGVDLLSSLSETEVLGCHVP